MNFEEDTWANLKKAIHAIHKKERTPHSLEELYKVCSFSFYHSLHIINLSRKMVENLCYHKMAANLYSNLHQEVELHIKDELKRLFVYPISTHTLHTDPSLQNHVTLLGSHSITQPLLPSQILTFDSIYTDIRQQCLPNFDG